MKKSKKVLTGIAVAAALIAAGVIGGGYLLTGDSRKNFPADGYILEVESGEDGQSVAGITFSMGTKYRGKFPSSYIIKDIQGNKNVVDSDSYIHYGDGSLSAFSDGMTVNMQEAGKGFLEFYRIKQGMVMTKAENGWQIDNNGNILDFPEMLWQISEDKVMAASDGMTLELPGREAEKISGYLEVTWPDKDVVQAANQDMVCQTMTVGGRILFESGAVLDLQERAVLNAFGEVSFTLEELMADMENGGITIRSNSDEQWIPPTFHVETEDGRDGESGEDGDGGESGENGETGQTGESGEDGEIGDDGEQGRQGNIGATGAEGATGASGVTAGAAGGSAGGNTANYYTGLGTVRISNLKYDCGKVDMTLVREDPDSTLTQDGVVELRDAVTNKLIASKSVDLSEMNTNPEIKVSFDNLSADREYVVLVKNGYSVEMVTESGAVANKGEKTFVKRNFSTNSEGVALEKTKVDTDSIMLSLKEFVENATDGKYGMLLIQCGDQWTTWSTGTGTSTSPVALGNWKNKDLLLDFETLFKGNAGTSDIPYRIEMYTCDDNAAQNWRSLVESGVAGENLHKSAQVIEGRTLKATPRIGQVSAVLSNEGYYDLSVEVEDDKDASIKNYKFTIAYPDGTAKVIESTSNKVKWYFGDGLESDSYTVACEVTYYDNEKNNIVNAIPTNITVTSTGSPTVVFEPYYTTINKDGSYQWTDKDKVLITSGSSSSDFGTGFGKEGERDSSVNATRIWGDLVLKPNGRNIPKQTLTIRITSNETPGENGSSGYNTTYSREITYNMTADNNGYAIQKIPVKCLGLKANTVYTISVWGTVSDEWTVGNNATSQTQQEVCFGSASVKTDKLAEVPDTETVAGFGIMTDRSEGRVARLYLYDVPENIDGGANDFDYINSTDQTSKYYFERSIARAVAIEVWTGGRERLLGTIVKDFSKMTTDAGDMGDYYGLNHSASDYVWQDPASITHAEARFFQGPLARDKAFSFYLMEEDFENAGINLSAYRTLLIEPVALYDYSYGLIDDSREYFGDVSDEDKYECFMAQLSEAVKMNYNSVPLRPVQLKYDDAVLTTLNSAVIDLDEQDPELINPPYEAIEVTELKNNISNDIAITKDKRTTDPLLKSDTTVGLKVQSKFPNRDERVVSITYYGMTMDDFNAYNNNPVSGMDIVKAYREGKNEAKNKIKIEVTLEMGISEFQAPRDAGVPPLYVIFTEDQELLNKCPSEQAEEKLADGSVITRTVYKATKDEKGRAVLYTKQMERGHCYVFAMTLKTMYHVVTDLIDPEPWEFPYELGRSYGYTSGPEYSWENMQRSSGTNVFKETPRVAAYLDHTEPGSPNKAYWEYLVYDPDGAMDNSKSKATAYGATGYAERVFAGAKEDLEGLIRSNYTNAGNTSKLVCVKTDKNLPADESDGMLNRELRKVLSQSFLLGATKDNKETIKNRLHKFALEVRDGDGVTLANPKAGVGEYEIWLASQEFDDKYGAYIYDANGETTAIAPEYRPSETQSEEHFALPTVKHDFDTMGGVTVQNIRDIQARVFLPDAQADNLSVNIVIPDNSQPIRKRIVGFYYEFYEAEYNGASNAYSLKDPDSPQAIQWGFVSYERTPQIVFDKPSAGDHIAVKMWAVYDTAVAGINREAIKSTTHNLAGQSDKKNNYENTDESYYAIQNQIMDKDGGSAYYTQNVNLTYENTTAAGSLFEWLGTDSGANSDIRHRIRSWQDTQAADLDYLYSAGGGKVGENMPLLKRLDETEIKIGRDSADKGEIVAGTGDDENKYIYLTVPATRPNIIWKKIEAEGFHSADVTVRFSRKTIETLLATQKEYGDKVYLELCDSSGKTALDNSGNRYFGFTEAREQTAYDNKAKKAAGTDLGALPEAEDLTGLLHGNGTEQITAYLQPEAGKTDYKIAIRNLDRDQQYVLKMYCIQENGTRIDILDNDTQEILSDKIGLDVKIEFATRDTLNIGNEAGNTGRETFRAVFRRAGYSSVNLSAIYGLDAVKDYYLQYRIYRIKEDGTAEQVILPDAMMSFLTENNSAYGNKTDNAFCYYDTVKGEWVENSAYPTYSQGGGAAYEAKSRTSTNPDRFVISGNSMSQLTPGRYYLELDAQDKYKDLGVGNGNKLPCKQDGTLTDNNGRTRVRVEFEVPEQEAPQYVGDVSYIMNDGDMTRGTANLTFRVTDSGYRLGLNDGGTTVGGKYRLELKINEGNSGTYTRVPLTAANIPSGNYEIQSDGTVILDANVLYWIQYPVQQGQRYEVQIYGVDTGEGPEEKLLYDSETNNRLKTLLEVSSLRKPQWKMIDSDFDMETGTVTVSAYQGANLEQIQTVSYTLYNPGQGVEQSGSVSASFSRSLEEEGWDELHIDINSILRAWEDNNSINRKDPLILTVSFQDAAGQSLDATETFTFKYK